MGAETKANRYVWLAYTATIVWLLLCDMGSSSNLIVCPTKLIWGIPCPGCGTTRATLLFIHGNIKEALMLNPNVIFAITFVFLFPFVAIAKLFIKDFSIYNCYQFTEKALKNPIIITLLLSFELFVFINNLINQT